MFQNARQKQRKIYENQPNNSYYETEEKKPNINYTCKKCNLIFQRYYELIRHQKNHCFKEENNKKSAKAQIAAAQIAHSLSSEDSNSSMDISNTHSCFGSSLSSITASGSIKASTSLNRSDSNLENPSGVGCNVDGGGSCVGSLGINIGGGNSSVPGISEGPNLNILGTQTTGSLGISKTSNGAGNSEGQSQSTPPDTIKESNSIAHAKVNFINGSCSNNMSFKSTINDEAGKLEKNSLVCEKCSLVFSREETLKEHQILHLMNPNFFINQNYGENTPFGILQNLSNESQNFQNINNRTIFSDLDEVELRNCKSVMSKSIIANASESQKNNQIDINVDETLKIHDENYLNVANIYKKCKNEQYDFLYDYYLQNKSNNSSVRETDIFKTEIPERMSLEKIINQNLTISDSSNDHEGVSKHVDYNFLLNFYQNNEIKKNGSYNILLQYYIKNEHRGETIDISISEKLNFDFLLQYYQLNEARKNFQINVPAPKMSSSQSSSLSTNENTKLAINSYNELQSKVNLNTTNLNAIDSLSTNKNTVSTNETDLNFNSSDKQNNKRLRTTILPEQLNFLYECYQNESNPSRKMLEEISKKVSLKKRVVQVSN